MSPQQMAEIYDKYSEAVFRTAFAYCKNRSDAEDIMQEVFLRRFGSSSSSSSSEQAEKSWLLKVTANMCRDMFRSLRYKFSLTAIPLDEASLVYETPEESAVYHAVMELPPKYRLVIHLYYYEGYSVSEIAGIVSASETAVQTRLYRARKSLKKALGKEFQI